VASGSSVQLWLAEHAVDGGVETVAVRLVVNPKEDEMAVSRWTEELELHQDLKQKSIPTTKAVFLDEKAFVVEWGSLLGLNELIAVAMGGGDRLEAGSVVRIGLAILDELKELQSLGHVHGNLSPDKIRFREDGQVLLYGLGTRPERVPPRYMVPEMAGEGEIGHPTDQWVVSAFLFELLMGRSLYPGDWSTAFKRALDGDNLEACQALVARFPQVAQALLPALRADGTEPYASHDEMLSALSSTLLMLGAGPSLITVLTEAKARSPKPAETRDGADGVSEEDVRAESAAVAPQLERVELAVVSESDSEGDAEESAEKPSVQESSVADVSSPELGASTGTGLDAEPAVELAVEPLAESTAEPVVEPTAEPKASGEIAASTERLLGPLGQPLTDWEDAEMASCLEADPVERGSWWVSRSTEQTTVKAPIEESPSLEENVEPIALAPEDAVEEESAAPVVEDAFSEKTADLSDEEERPAAVAYTPFPEVDTVPELSFETVEKEELLPPVLEELPPIPTESQAPAVEEPVVEEPVRDEPPRMPLPGLASVSEALLAEKEDADESEADDLPWDQPEVIIPAPVRPLQVEPPPLDTPDILSPRRPVSSRREEMVGWEHNWTVRPLSERIARGSLLVLLGMGLAWWVVG